MICTVRTYSATGFNLDNLPSSPNVLDTGDFVIKDYPDIAVKQTFDLNKVILHGTWNQLKDVDYIRITSPSEVAFFVVTLNTMVNDNAAELTIALDPLNTSGGINQITIMAGETRRVHVQDDSFGKYRDDEPFTPSNPLILRNLEVFFGKEDGETTKLFAISKVYLTDIDFNQAEDYTSLDGLTVTVPQIPPVTFQAIYTMQPWGSQPVYKSRPNEIVYDMTDAEVQKNIQKLRSLGIEGAITDTLAISSSWLTNADNTEMRGLTGVYRWYTYTRETNFVSTSITIKNQKAFSGQFQKITIGSFCSGDSITFDMEDVSTDTGRVEIFGTSDPSPDGRPYAHPAVYKGTQLSGFNGIPWHCAVSGAEWERVPITYTTRAGQWQNDQRQKFSNIRQIANIISGGVQQLTSDNPNVIGALTSSANNIINSAESAYNYQEQRYINTPQTFFHNNPSLQNYYGNCFVVYSTTLSNDDFVRFDNFLNAYGYSIQKTFEHIDLDNRTVFNYVQTRDANVRSIHGYRISQELSRLFDRGVRLWHSAPSATKLKGENPVRS